MASKATAMRVFVASPGDVEPERDALARVLTDVNLALEDALRWTGYLDRRADRVRILRTAKEELRRRAP